MFLRALFKAQGEVNPVDDTNDNGLPGNQVSEPVKQLSIQDMCLLPAGKMLIKESIQDDDV